MKISDLFAGQLGLASQERPPQALERRIGPLFNSPHPVHRRARLSDDVELIESDVRVRQTINDII